MHIIPELEEDQGIQLTTSLFLEELDLLVDQGLLEKEDNILGIPIYKKYEK